MTKTESTFTHELSLIHNPDIKNFVITCFDKLCPDYFWTCPCSTTGKYHPQVALGVGGLVRHTKLAVWWGLELLKALGTSPELKNITTLRDEVIATLLLHDMIKNGEGLNSQGYPLDRSVTGTHGVTLASKIHDNIAGDCKLDHKIVYNIINGIASHMGIWTTDGRFKPKTPFENLIHLADYAASRKVDEIYLLLGDEKNDAIQESTIQETLKSPPCPGVRKTESCQTTAAESQ